jgi:hypothetical protein
VDVHDAMWCGVCSQVANLSLVEANRVAVVESVLPDLMLLAQSRDVRVQHCCASVSVTRARRTTHMIRFVAHVSHLS